MVKKGKKVLQFDDPDWMANFGFLVDISTYLNDLNLILQVKDQLVHKSLWPSKGIWNEATSLGSSD